MICKWKKIIVTMVTVVLIFCFLSCEAAATTAGKKYEPLTDSLDKYLYTVSGETAEITGCTAGLSGKVEVPAIIDGYEVTAISSGVLKGIDVSVHNDDIDWAKVKAAGVQFAILRLGYGDDETDQDDKRFEEYVKGCEANGIPWGAYIYSYALNIKEANSEVAHCLRKLKGKKPEYPIVFDMEDGDTYKARHGGLSKEMAVNICKTFLDRMQEEGYYVSLYASLSWFDGILNDERLAEYDKWVAQWNSECQYDKPYGMWQYGASVNFIDGTGVDGINGNVDKDFAYKDYPSIIKQKGLNGWEAGSENKRDCSFGAFQNKTDITEVVLPNTVRTISGSAFQNCSSLESITLSDNIESIGECAFYGCDNLKTVYYAGDEKSFNNISVLAGNDAIKNAKKVFLSAESDGIAWEYDEEKGSLIIRGSGTIKETKNNDSWNYCLERAKRIVIRQGVEGIAENAFSFIKAKSIVIPYSVSSINENALPKAEDLVVTCVPGSVSEEYANKNGIKHIEKSNGDLDNNSQVTSADVVRLVYGIYFQKFYPLNTDCDFNNDSTIDDKDANYLLFHIFFPEVYEL